LLYHLDRWGSVLLIYLLPWQARIIFREGYLAGAPSEPLTVSLYAVEALIAAMLAVRLVRLYGAPNRGPVFPDRGPYRQIVFAFAAILLLALVSLLIAADRATVLTAVRHLAEGLAVFFLIITAVSESELRLAFVVSALVQALLALSQAYFQNILPDSWLGQAAHDPSAAGTSVVESSFGRFLRAYGTFPHPNILGGFLAAVMLAARPLFRRFTVVSAATYLLLAVGLFFSFSRLAAIALAVGIAGQWLWASRDRVFMKNMIVALAGLALLSALFWPYALARTAAAGRLEARSVAARLAGFADAWRLIVRHPSTGVGAGSFTPAVLAQLDPTRDGWALEPVHSAPAAVFAEIGFFGFLLYLWLLGLVAWGAWKSGKIGLAAALLVLALGDHWSWTTFPGILVFWSAWGFSMRRCQDGCVKHKAGAIVVSSEDPMKILLVYRYGSPFSDWSLPKGHMEHGELREDTARREIYEETGLSVKILKPLSDREYITGHGNQAVAHFFLVRSLDDSKLRVEPRYPNNRLEWLHLLDADNRLTNAGLKKYFRSILPEIKDELEDLARRSRAGN
jgi:ADP-ribose pyrophosphatase YjhB (NUDIX family)/O-antigen ligase